MGKQKLKDNQHAIKPAKRSARAERILKKREPQLIETVKNTLIIRGNHTSQLIMDVLSDFAKLTKPNGKSMSRKNDIFPFEDANSLEFLTEKNDCALFVFGSHSKKRPNNLILGRTYDGHILDMMEFGVDSFQAIESFHGSKKAIGSKPLLLFLGSQWETDTTYTRIQNYLIDLLRGVKLDKITLQGLDHAISCAVIDGIIYIRGFSIAFKKSGTKVPYVQLSDMGPFLNLSLRRTQLASDDMWKTAIRRPKAATTKKVKNINHIKGDKIGRIHVEKQNLDQMGGRRVTALRDKGGKTGLNMKKRTLGGSDSDEYLNKKMKQK